jgi:hypothetical protein
VQPRAALHIKFPIVDHSTPPGAAAGSQPPRFSVAIVPQCAEPADLVAGLAPAGSGKRLVARLACDGSTVDMSSDDDGGGDSDDDDNNDDDDDGTVTVNLAELRASVIQLEIIDDPEHQRLRADEMTAAGGRRASKAGQKQQRARLGQYRRSSGSDSSSDTVVKVKQ